MLVKKKRFTDSVERSIDQQSNTVVPVRNIQLSGRSRPGVLVDVSKVLDDMGCKVSIAGVWSHKGGVACVIHLTCDAIVEFAKMDLMWERLFPILQGHDNMQGLDNEQVVERVAVAEFPLMERNMFSFSSPSRSSYVHVHRGKTERGNGDLTSSNVPPGDNFRVLHSGQGNNTLIAHVKFANILYPLRYCWRYLEDCGYGVRKATIYHPGQQNFQFGRTGESYKDIDLNGEGFYRDIEVGALQRYSVQTLQLSITGTRVELIEDLLEFFRRSHVTILRAHVSDAHEITFYVGESGDSRNLDVVLPHPISRDRDLCISYPNINLWLHIRELGQTIWVPF